MLSKKNYQFKNIQLSKKATNIIIMVSNLMIGMKAKPSQDIKEFHNFLRNLIENETSEGSTDKQSTPSLSIIIMGTIINPDLPQQQPILNALIQHIAYFHATFYILNSPNIECFESMEYLDSKKFVLFSEEDYILIDQSDNEANKIKILISYDFKASERLDIQSLSNDETNDVKNSKEIRKLIVEDKGDKSVQNWIVLGALKSAFVIKDSFIMSVGHCVLGNNENSYGIIRFDNEFSMEAKCIFS